jgi:hypothetical protein
VRRAAFALLPVLAVLLIPASAVADDCPQGTGDGATFGYTHELEHIAVPPGVKAVTVIARGAHGGQTDSTGYGGAGGLVTATIPVDDKECLTIQVGQQGHHEGSFGWGYGQGGEPGKGQQDGLLAGHDGAGGGGGTAVLRGTTPLVVAGGGGGGGGESLHAGYYGGAGGDGVNGDGPGTPRGTDGANPYWEYEFPMGGRGGGLDHESGGHGTDEELPYYGAGGGGGGGYHGGEGGDAWFYQIEIENEPYGGAGGGGGSSYVVRGAPATYQRADTVCRTGETSPDCDGQVVLHWVQEPAHVAADGGTGQTTTITEPFAQPLRAKVTALSGEPVADAAVTFRLPSSGASATFTDGTTEAVAHTDADGVATSPHLTAGATAGSWAATASVSGVTTSAAFPLRNAPGTAVVVAQSNPDAPVDGAATQLVAQVTGAPAAAPPVTGSVRFRLDGVAIAEPVAVDADGLAILDGVALPKGRHEIDAIYGGDDNHALAAGGTVVQVAGRPSTVALTASQNPSPVGVDVTYTATVAAAGGAAGAPSGNVALVVDGSTVAQRALSGGSVDFGPIAVGAAGPHVIEALYQGDDHFATSAGRLIQSVGADATATTVTSSAPYARYGDPLSFTVHVASSLPGTPTGSVDVTVGGIPVCTGISLASGTAVCVPPASLDPGTAIVAAHYSGDGTHAPSTGEASQTVAAAPVAVSATIVPDRLTFGDTVRLHADVASGGAGTPTGSVRFLMNGTPVGDPVALAAAGATLDAVPVPEAGPVVVQAFYSGNTRFTSGAGNATAVVARAPSSVVLRSSQPGGAATGTPVVFTATVSSDGRGTPQGAVRFIVDGAQFGAPSAISGGVALSAPIADLAAGRHTVIAEYTGQNDHLPAMDELFQTIVASSGGGGGGAGGDTPSAASDGPTTLSPPPTPPSQAEQAAEAPCFTGVVITGLHHRRGRVTIDGLAQPEDAGRRVAVTVRRHRAGTTWVGDSGRFRVTVRAPTGRRATRAPFRVSVAGVRSPVAVLRPATRVVRRATARDGTLHVVVAAGRGRGRVELRAEACAPTRAIAVHKGRGTVTLPATEHRIVVYRLYRGGRRVAGAPAVVVAPR